MFSGTSETWIGGWVRSVGGVTSEEHLGSLTELVAGPVTEMFPSGCTETYGPTNGIWATLTWVSPGVQITAPSTQFVAPVRFKLTANWDDTKIADADFKPVDSGASAIKIEGLGVTAVATHSKAEATGLALSLTGGAVEAGFVNMKYSAVYIGPVVTNTN